MTWAYPRWRGEHSLPTGRAGGGKAYPRWRGEHGSEGSRGQIVEGLPPLARGAPPRRPARERDVRPTPAGAGSTASADDSVHTLWAYPRWRGSTTPACVLWAMSRAYPRWRGEHFLLGFGLAIMWGLPPLARGALLNQRIVVSVTGPTPAGAGSTADQITERSRGRAYPRWRGEHRQPRPRQRRHRGLPPLARGAPVAYAAEQHVYRPTPAGAGSTCGCVGCGGRPQAYPRWRGEHSSPLFDGFSNLGLPPLARGAHARSRGALRFTGAYPRWRGEHMQTIAVRYTTQGLPPLARGAHWQTLIGDGSVGPTPAGAGSTYRPTSRDR